MSGNDDDDEEFNPPEDEPIDFRPHKQSPMVESYMDTEEQKPLEAVSTRRHHEVARAAASRPRRRFPRGGVPSLFGRSRRFWRRISYHLKKRYEKMMYIWDERIKHK